MDSKKLYFNHANLQAKIHEAGCQVGDGTLNKLEQYCQSIFDYYISAPQTSVIQLQTMNVEVNLKPTVVEQYLKSKGLDAPRRREITSGGVDVLGHIVSVSLLNCKKGGRVVIMPDDIETAYFTVWNLIERIRFPAAPAPTPKKRAPTVTQASSSDVK